MIQNTTWLHSVCIVTALYSCAHTQPSFCSITIFISLSNFPPNVLLSSFKLHSRQSRCPSVCGSLIAGNASSNPVGFIDVSLVNVECCERPIIHLEESYRMCVCVCVCVSINVIRCNMNAQHFKWVGRRDRTKREGREPVTKIPQMTPKLHTAHCSYNIYSVRSLKLHCHKGPKIRKFNFDSKCAAKTGFGKSS